MVVIVSLLARIAMNNTRAVMTTPYPRLAAIHHRRRLEGTTNSWPTTAQPSVRDQHGPFQFYTVHLEWSLYGFAAGGAWASQLTVLVGLGDERLVVPPLSAG